MRVTIAGMPGSGKSTVARKVAAALQIPSYSVGDLRGRMAVARGLTIDGLNEIGEVVAWTDKEADDAQVRLAETEKDFVMDGRLSWHFIPDALHVFLDVDPAEGARRIFADTQAKQRPDERAYTSQEDVAAAIAQRVASDRRRYERLYQLDCFDHAHFSLVLDTTTMTPDEVVAAVVAEARFRYPAPV